MMYAESATLTLALGDVTKLAVRRPRTARVHAASPARQELPDPDAAESMPDHLGHRYPAVVLLGTLRDHGGR